jgi:hypothetical protein
MFDDFLKADPVPRGCGEREPGGVYVESGLSPWGRPIEEFLIDPPLPIPEGLDLVNKPQLRQRTSFSGEPILDEQEQPIYDLLIWIGQEFYPYCCDYIEETRRYGASRRLNSNLDLSLLSQASRMILAHLGVINTLWQEQRPPQECGKHMLGHTGEPAHIGPCLFKLWELIPQDAASAMVNLEGAAEEYPLCLRDIGSTTYHYHPTGESEDGLVPGLFAALPVTGFALIQFADGSVNEKAKRKIVAGLETHGDQAVPWYESQQ